MTYDPKKTLWKRREYINDNLGTPRYQMSEASSENKVEPIPQPASLGEQLMKVGKIVALVLASLAGSVIALQSAGVVLPAWLLTLATTVLALAAPLGIGSSGLSKKDLPPDAPLK
jgi:hypothetical protein